MFKRFAYFLLLLLAFGSRAQQAYIDSVTALINKTGEDTIRLGLLLDLANTINDDQLWPKYNMQAYELATKLMQNDNESIVRNSKKALASTLNNIGIEYKFKGDIHTALSYYYKAMQLHKELGNLKGMANILINIGTINYHEGNINKALENFSESLKIEEQVGDKEGVGHSLNNLAIIYNDQGDYKKALDYYERCLKLRAEVNDQRGYGYTLNNMGAIYSDHKERSKALEYYKKALDLQEKIGDKRGAAFSLNNIGRDYMHDADYTAALSYFLRSMQLQKLTKDKQGLTTSYTNIADVHYRMTGKITPGNKKRNFDLAYAYADSSLSLCKELGFPENLGNVQWLMSRIDSARGNFAGAFGHYKQYITLRDSINNESTRKASIKNQLKYEFEKKEAIIIEQQEKERAVAEEKSSFQQIVIGVVAFGLILVIVFAFFIARTLKETKVQKLIIEHKQHEILDSIRYAKRIQTAVITSESYIDRNLERLQKIN